MDQNKINKAMSDWRKQAKEAQLKSNLAAGNASTLSYSSSSNSSSTSRSEESNYIEVSPSAPPPETEKVELRKYLEKYIDGYLIGDLESLIRNVKPRGERFNCSFVIILTICTGIEFLGALLKPGLEDVYSRRKDGDYFGHYWKNYLSKINTKYDKTLDGQIARDLIRNGLAHHFIIKPGLGSVRSQRDRHLEVSKQQGVLVIDADWLYEDFKNSYEKIAKPKLLDKNEGEKLASKRLEQILNEFKGEVSFRRLSQILQSGEDSKTGGAHTTTLPPI